MNPEERVYAYEVDVTFPDVSGMEHIEMFYNRSSIAEIEDELTPEQKDRVKNADQILLRDAQMFVDALKQIVDLKKWREQDDAPPEHWWWYLDVIVALPTTPVHVNGTSQVKEPQVAEAA